MPHHAQAIAYGTEEAPAPTTELRSVVKRGDQTFEYARNLAARIEIAADRLVGPTASAISGKPADPSPPPSSIIGELNANVDAIYLQLDRIAAQLDRLEVAI